MIFKHSSGYPMHVRLGLICRKVDVLYLYSIDIFEVNPEAVL